MNAFYDLARVTTATTGTGTITLGAAVLGYLTFAQAGVPNGAIVSYGIADGANSETGWGVYTAAGTTLTRNVYRSTGAGNNTPINLSGSAQLFITALAADFAAFYSTNGILKSNGAGTIGAAIPDQDFALPVWGVDLDFTTGIYYAAPYNAPNTLTVSRASVGYIDTVAGVWSEVAANTLRRSDKGALIEEARTNSIRNNSMQGAVAGTPGTLPTYWGQYLAGTGITRSVVGTGTENGIDYIDLRFSGTPTATAGAQFYFETGTGISAANGQTWSTSFFYKLAGGSLTNVSAVRLGTNVNDAGGAFLATLFSLLITPTGAIQRASATGTISNASAGTVLPYIQIEVTNGLAIDVTLRIGWPQTERGSWASSPIRTTSAAATRAADVVSLTAPPSFGLAQTLAFAGTPLAPTNYATLQVGLGVNDGTASNRLLLYRNASTGIPVWLLNSTAVVIGAAAWGQAVAGIVDVANATGSQAGSFNGSAPTTGTTANTLTLPNVQIGHSNSSSQWNGYISRVLIWPESRLSNPNIVHIATALPEAAGHVISGNRGTSANDNAPAGDVGEVMSSIVLIGSNVALTTNVAVNVTSLALTAGDWDVFGEVWFNPAGSTNIAQVVAGINTISATVPTGPETGKAVNAGVGSSSTGVSPILPVGPCRISVAATTTVYLIARSTFTVSTNAAYGRIGARRAR